MDRIHFLTAEVYSYSFANYENHLGIGHVRFEELMPRDAEILEQAERESWSDEQIAEALGTEILQVFQIGVTQKIYVVYIQNVKSLSDGDMRSPDLPIWWIILPQLRQNRKNSGDFKI